MVLGHSSQSLFKCQQEHDSIEQALSLWKLMKYLRIEIIAQTAIQSDIYETIK